jgi:hypothetical protein
MNEVDVSTGSRFCLLCCCLPLLKYSEYRHFDPKYSVYLSREQNPIDVRQPVDLRCESTEYPVLRTLFYSAPYSVFEVLRVLSINILQHGNARQIKAHFVVQGSLCNHDMRL